MVADRQDGDPRFQAAGAAQEVPGHRLRGTDSDVARVLAEHQLNGPALVAVTGWGQHSDKTRARASGFDHHFTKPLKPERLLELLRDAGE